MMYCISSLPSEVIVSESSSNSPDENTIEREYIDIGYKKKSVNFWKSGKKRPLSFKSVQSKFRKLKNCVQLYSWEEQIKSGGSRIDKLNSIANMTLEKLVLAQNRNIIVHDINLRRWVLQEKQKLNLEEFQASHTWLRKFKQAHNIVSRKTRKFITRNYSDRLTDINARADEFAPNVFQYFHSHGAANIFKSDQTGFQLEMHSGRPLSWKGEKHTQSVIQSSSAMTHSYTIQPTISADGQLLSPLFIVLKETSSKLGPRVQSRMFTAPNVVIKASTSGKLNKGLLRQWLESVFFPHSPENSILLLDYWTHGQDMTEI
ncbi:hypothetical protein ANTPLA_LOCUS2902 [Anthophora plagiata]